MTSESILRRAVAAAKVIVARGRLSVGGGTRIDASARFIFRLRGKIRIGSQCDIGPGALLATYGGDIQIGDRCSVNAYAVLYGQGGLTIGDDVRIASHVVIVPSQHNYRDRNRTIKSQGTTDRGIAIDDDVWIGANVTILDGTHIAKGCIIGAGAVVRGTTEPFGVYVGVPAHLLKFRDEAK